MSLSHSARQEARAQSQVLWDRNGSGSESDHVRAAAGKQEASAWSHLAGGLVLLLPLHLNLLQLLDALLIYLLCKHRWLREATTQTYPHLEPQRSFACRVS